jgi:hypothetical protein
MTNDDGRANATMSVDLYADSGAGYADTDLDRALAALRGGDSSTLAALIVRRTGFRQTMVSDALTGELDEPSAVLARAAGLPWEAFEAILNYRARRYGRSPGLFTQAIRLFRDVSTDRARALFGRAQAADQGFGHGPTG